MLGPGFNHLPDGAGSSSLPGSRSASPAPGAHPTSAATGSPTLGSTILRRPASHGRLAKLMVPGRSRSNSGASQEASTVTAYAEEIMASSGRTTPEQRRRSARAAAASLLASDSKYKKFAAQVDRCLQSFESVNEWADFISFLSRLLKTLQTPSPSYSEIPRKLIVAKRLAQCLNPALPSGVHTRALDVYAYVFSIIGHEGLHRDLLVWSSGLFPFFQFASTSVRPALIKIYEQYYIPLREDLRPATKALVLALLPGIEEETGDFFDKILTLLSHLSDAVSASFFLQNVFLILVSAPGSRLAALNYLNRKLSDPLEDLGTDADFGLLIRGVAATLGDGNMLVCRSGLDLLLRILPLDGDIMRQASESDRQLLFQAASEVVLQRDMSLSRRVYSWLLGKGETPALQVEYLQANSIDMLVQTLQSSMSNLATSHDISEGQIPFKVFLSLLDKWEIGESLSSRLSIPALEALRDASASRGVDSREEVRSTAIAVYEAVEPEVLWPQFQKELLSELVRGVNTHLSLLQWLVSCVHQHDDEAKLVFIPTLLDELLNVVKDGKVADTCMDSALRLASSLLHLVPAQLFTLSTPQLSSGNAVMSPERGTSATMSSRLTEQSKSVKAEAIPRIVHSVFTVCEKTLASQKSSETVLLAVDLAYILVEREVPLLSVVDASAWVTAILQRLGKGKSFAEVDALVDIALKASRSQAFNPPVDISSDEVITGILNSLFRYLKPLAAPYHVRVVELVWEFNQLAEIYTLENVIARRMSAVVGKVEAFEAFGVLWRQTDDAMLPGEIFYVPMLMILDGLKSDDPELLRICETWMRSNLRSYFRILDPLLRRIIVSIRAPPSKIDRSQIQYILQNLVSLFKFGGQGLSKACQSTEVAKSSNAVFSSLCSTAFPNAVFYLDVLVEMLTSLLGSQREAQTLDTSPADPRDLRVETVALELLQMLVSRGDLSAGSVTLVKSSLMEKLESATRHRHLTLQNTMLHILHSAITASMDKPHRSHQHSLSLTLSEKSPRPDDDARVDFDTSLIRIISLGLSSQGNQPVLQHWVDFILMTCSYLERKPHLVQELCDCVCEQLRIMMLRVKSVHQLLPSVTDVLSSVTDAEPTMLLTLIERVATMMGARSGQRKSEDGVRPTAEGGSGILGYLPTVFSVEAPAESFSKSTGPRYLDDVIDALLVTWTVTSEHDLTGPPSGSDTQTRSRIRNRARKVLEKLFKQKPSEIILSCINVWASKSGDISDSSIFDCIDVLTPSAQKVVEIICDFLGNKTGRAAGPDARPDPAFLAFLEAYISRLEGPIAVQVWNTLYGYTRDVLNASNTPSARSQLFAVLRCLTVLGGTVATTSALEDRRLRRDLQETFVKVLDLVASNVPRLAETATWTREVSKLDEKHDGDEEKEPEQNVADGAHRIHAFIGDKVVSSLRTFLLENDKVSAACASISSGILAPAFKQQRVDDAINKILAEMTSIPAAVRSWRLQIGEAFNDQRFFKIKPDDSQLWKPLICAMMDSDKERLGDLLGRITAAPSANIFTNREQEMVSRSLNLRRLSFVILAAERNHHLAQLPSIQEKLVEILRTNVVSPRVHSEVYLCLRVLMCRISPQHLTNFWPVILTELLRVFESTMDEPPADGSENLQLVLAACKFLDLLLVIQSEDFQIHQWIFVTDTTDAANPPEDYQPEAIMDRLSDILTEQAHATMISDEPVDSITESNGLRRPRLAAIKTLANLHQLHSFFSRASIDTFEGVYSNVGVDWDAVEEGLVGEIFEGKE